MHDTEAELYSTLGIAESGGPASSETFGREKQCPCWGLVRGGVAISKLGSMTRECLVVVLYLDASYYVHALTGPLE